GTNAVALRVRVRSRGGARTSNGCAPTHALARSGAALAKSPVTVSSPDVESATNVRRDAAPVWLGSTIAPGIPDQSGVPTSATRFAGDPCTVTGDVAKNARGAGGVAISKTT